MRSLLDRVAVAVGDEAPDFSFAVAGSSHRLTAFRGSPVVLAFHGTHWDPARAEHIETYNKLIASLGGVAGARLLEIGGEGPWRELSFTDDALSLPVLASMDETIASLYGVGGEPAVFVIDAEGIVRWSQVGPMSLANPAELARVISVVAAPLVAEPNEEAACGGAWTRRDFVATTLAAAFAPALRPI